MARTANWRWNFSGEADPHIHAVVSAPRCAASLSSCGDALAVQQSEGEGANVFSFSLTDDAPPRLETPLAFDAPDSEERSFSQPMNWLWTGLGIGVAYRIYDSNAAPTNMGVRK